VQYVQETGGPPLHGPDGAASYYDPIKYHPGGAGMVAHGVSERENAGTMLHGEVRHEAHGREVGVARSHAQVVEADGRPVEGRVELDAGQTWGGAR
jgi:hypothetical protein